MPNASSSGSPPPGSGGPVNHVERGTELGRMRQAGIVRLIASVEELTSLEGRINLPPPPQQQAIQQSYRYPPELDPSPAPTCPVEPPTWDAFTVKLVKGKFVRDVWMDTHDLINEPGGYLINLSRHGGTSPAKSLRIHLGIRPNRDRAAVNGTQSPIFSTTAFSRDGNQLIQPGTITPTDDFAREIFLEILSHPELSSLYIILEICKREDSYHEKNYEENNSTGFLPKFIPKVPTSLTKLQVEIPGVSAAYLREWKYLLDQQTSLQELICNFGVVMWHFYETMAWKNAKTLRKIILRRLQTFDVNKSKFTPMNWAIFSDCHNLTYLKVTCGYKTNSREWPEPSCPPTHVFLHENIDTLPQNNSFVELHLGKIWVEPCQIQRFCKERPRLHLCLNCNEQECGEDEDPPSTRIQKQQRGYKQSTELRYFHLSSMELAAVIPPTGSLQRVGEQQREDRSLEPNPRYQSSFSRYGRIILTLFITILVALAILFIVIFFKHLRSERNNPKLVDMNESPGGTVMEQDLDKNTENER